MADTDLAELRKKCITSLYLCADNVSKYLDKEKDEEFAKLRSIVQEYCLLEAKQDFTIQALRTVKHDTNASNFDTLDERFLALCNQKQRNISNHPFLQEFDRRTTKVHTQNLDESDVAITETQEKHIDPITLKRIINPMRNRLCSHIYERDTILLYITRERAKCPVAGCANRERLLMEHLIDDEEMRFRIDIDHHSTLVPGVQIQNLDETMD